MVTDNGVDVSDARVMTRTNEATQLILGMQNPQTGEPIIPVNGMMIAEVDVVDSNFYLPPQMDSAIHMESAVAETDIRQGFYNIINPFTYVDPSMSHDQPFYDVFYAQPLTAGVFQRHYFYPDFPNGRIRVVGPKAYIPITSDADTLIVQNVPALKKMIQSIEYAENNQVQEEKEYYDRSREIILGEIKKHNMDPRWIIRRKSDYERDLSTFRPGTKGWTRARLALEVPGALDVGRQEIGWILDRAQLRMMEAGTWRGCLEQFNARITDGHVYLPSRVEAILGASFDGAPIYVRSMFYKFMQSGPGEIDCTCGGRLEDEGETFFPGQNQWRRTYRAKGAADGSEFVAVCKLRWEIKRDQDFLTIRNLEANRSMTRAILLEQAGETQHSANIVNQVLGAGGILERELREYMRGIQQIIPQAPTLGVGDLGIAL